MVITKISKNKEKIRILRYLPNDQWSRSGKNINKFSGSIEFYSKKGEFLGKLEMLDGKGKKDEQQNIKTSSTSCTYTFGNSICTGDLHGGDTYTCSIQYTESCTTTFKPDSGPTGNNNENETIDQGDSGGGITTPIPDEEEALKIINKLEGRAKCVYDKMVNNGDNINWILKNFNDGNIPSEFDLIIEMSTTLGDSTNASTIKSGNTFIIGINANRIPDRTSLSIARTIIHEGIHARLREFASRNGSNATEFPGVYDYFRTYGKNWDHQQMADFYRKTIAEGLQQYDNNQHAPQFYMDLAWEGLSQIIDANNTDNPSSIYTEAWKKLSSSDQERVLLTIANEKRNGSKECEEE